MQESTNHKISRIKALLHLIIDVSVIAIFTLLVFTFVFGIYVQDGNDMYPSIMDGDIAIYFRHASYIPTEAVVYVANDQTHIGRIAATSGSVISETGDHQLTINGIFQPEDPENGIYSSTMSGSAEDLPLTISEEGCFILNDNRCRTSDSRTFGEISKDSVKGRIITILRRRYI